MHRMQFQAASSRGHSAGAAAPGVAPSFFRFSQAASVASPGVRGSQRLEACPVRAARGRSTDLLAPTHTTTPQGGAK